MSLATENLQASAPVAGASLLGPLRPANQRQGKHDDGGWAIKWALEWRNRAQRHALSSAISLRQSFQIASLAIEIPHPFAAPAGPATRRKGAPLTRRGPGAHRGRTRSKKRWASRLRVGATLCVPARRLPGTAAQSLPCRWPLRTLALGRESVGETNASQRAETSTLLRHGGAWSRISKSWSCLAIGAADGLLSGLASLALITLPRFSLSCFFVLPTLPSGMNERFSSPGRPNGGRRDYAPSSQPTDGQGEGSFRTFKTAQGLGAGERPTRTTSSGAPRCHVQRRVQGRLNRLHRASIASWTEQSAVANNAGGMASLSESNEASLASCPWHHVETAEWSSTPACQTFCLCSALLLQYGNGNLSLPIGMG